MISNERIYWICSRVLDLCEAKQLRELDEWLAETLAAQSWEEGYALLRYSFLDRHSLKHWVPLRDATFQNCSEFAEGNPEKLFQGLFK